MTPSPLVRRVELSLADEDVRAADQKLARASRHLYQLGREAASVRDAVTDARSAIERATDGIAAMQKDGPL